MKKTLLSLIALVSLVASAQAMAAVYTVSANANATTLTGRVGVSVAPLTVGSTFTISANPLDLWDTGAAGRWSNANGLTGPNLLSTGAADINGDNPNVRAGRVIGSSFANLTLGGLTAAQGALVGEWSNNLGQYFLIGTNYSGVALASGLKLYNFDTTKAGNTGSILVNFNVNVSAVPEPETYNMMLAGLVFIGFAVGRRND